MLARASPAAPAVFPSDDLFNEQIQHWIRFEDSTGESGEIGLLHTPEAWAITTGSASVRVGIVSTGIDARLLELAGRLITGSNFVDETNVTQDKQGPGTRMATVLGANANNANPLNPAGPALGIAGVDWQCKIMPLKVLDDYYGPSTTARFGDAISFAADHGCKVILVGSTTGVSDTQPSEEPIATAISNAVARGAIVIASAGSESRNISGPAAKHPLAITIGAAQLGGNPISGLSFQRALFSNTGPELDFVALGAFIYCIEPSGNEYGADYKRSSTDLAAAMAAGTCSLIAALRPEITWRDAYLLLAAGASDGALDTPGWDEETGWGLINAYNSVLLAALRINSARKLANGQIELRWPSPPMRWTADISM